MFIIQWRPNANGHACIHSLSQSANQPICPPTHSPTNQPICQGTNQYAMKEPQIHLSNWPASYTKPAARLLIQLIIHWLTHLSDKTNSTLFWLRLLWCIISSSRIFWTDDGLTISSLDINDLKPNKSITVTNHHQHQVSRNSVDCQL